MACDQCNKKDNCKLNIGRGCCFCVNEERGETEVYVCEGAQKLHITDWLKEYPANLPDDIFEIRFKNTRKSYYRNASNLPLQQGDIVAVEASPGHDIGIVSLTGDMVAKQMKRIGFTPMNGEFKKIYRKAKPYDIEKWQEAIALEHSTMIKSRQIVTDLKLDMKIGDVEYQGDKIKAIFYYIADERVDFRELIKVLADQFKIRVEMKQIGARQEAGRIGGIGSCGRELCCSSWISSFVSVTTNSARYQEISLNPQKLAGQCGKLKCCLIYELDSYMDARKAIPRISAPLETLEGSYYLVKTDIFRRKMGFSSDPNGMVNFTELSVDRVKEIVALNRKGQKVPMLIDPNTIEASPTEEPDYANVVGIDSITRFDSEGTRSAGGRRRRGRGGNGGNGGNGAGNSERRRNEEPRNTESRGESTETRSDKSRTDKPRNSSMPERRNSRPNPQRNAGSETTPSASPERMTRTQNRPESSRPENDNSRPESRRPRPNQPTKNTTASPEVVMTSKPEAAGTDDANQTPRRTNNNRHRSRNRRPRNPGGNNEGGSQQNN